MVDLDANSDPLQLIKQLNESETAGLSLVIIGTANSFVKLLDEKDEVGKCYSIVLDKIDLLQAFGFKPQLD